jgi:hypothetical protein
VTPLCQRGPASCGACCGLYNQRDLSRDGLRSLLRRRTDVLARAPRTAAGFRAAAQELAPHEPEPLFPSVKICPLLGYLDSDETRVGCLAHPLSTGGPDLRICGVYTADICSSFFCPSHSWLSEDDAQLVATICADFHLYGLVVTDVQFVRACLSAVASLAGARVELRHLKNDAFVRALRELFSLKEELEPGSEGLYGAFCAGSDGEPVPRQIDFRELGRDTSTYEEILTCMGADPRSGNDLEVLEREVRRRLQACQAAL